MNYRRYTKRHLAKSLVSSFLSNLFKDISVTGWLIIANVFFFIIFSIMLLFSQSFFDIQASTLLTDFIALKPINILQGRAIWTFLTSMFMHGGLGHLLINMFVLFSLGGTMEKIIGRKRFLWFYLLSGIFAGLTFVVLAGLFGGSELGSSIFGSITIPAVGASGAIFAIAGLFVVLIPKARFMIIFLPFFSLPGYILVPAVLVLTWIASVAGGLPVGNSAHFGGFLIGLIYGFYLRNKYKKKVARLNKMIR